MSTAKCRARFHTKRGQQDYQEQALILLCLVADKPEKCAGPMIFFTHLRHSSKRYDFFAVFVSPIACPGIFSCKHFAFAFAIRALFFDPTIRGRICAQDEQFALALDVAGDFNWLGDEVQNFFVHGTAVGGDK
jgi:hypothetical protein